MKRTCGLALGVLATTLMIAACGESRFELGHWKEGTLPEARHRGVAAQEVATSDNPCKRGDVAGCIDKCQAGEARACNAVGVMFEFGHDEPDGTLASGFYTRACNANYAPGCTNLGWLYSLGRGVPRDAQQALNLFTRAYDSSRLACRHGDGSGCLLAGELLLQGSIDVDDDTKAVAYFRQACDAGVPRGCDYLSQLE